MQKTILVFGYIPKARGGKQTTGLATGIFDLHNAVNTKKSKFNTVIAATDIHESFIQIDDVGVYGWTSKTLLSHSAKHPLRFLYFLFRSVILFFKFRKVVKLFDTLAKLIFLDYAVEKSKCDLIHLHGATGALLSTGIWLKKQNVILRIHGINGRNPSIPNFDIHYAIEKYVTKLLFTKVTFVSRYNIQQWKEIYGEFSCDMVPILNGYNPKIFKPIPHVEGEVYDLITVSGISENKGQIRVLKAISRLKSAGINLSYLMVGSGNKSYLESLRGIIEIENLNVDIKGYMPQDLVNSQVQKSRYFILPSIAEGFGKVFIESIGAGTPIIIPATLPLSRELGLIGSTNAIVIPDSSVESIYNGLFDIFSNPRIYKKDFVASTVSHLAWDEIAKEYISLYTDIFDLAQPSINHGK